MLNKGLTGGKKVYTAFPVFGANKMKGLDYQRS